MRLCLLPSERSRRPIGGSLPAVAHVGRPFLVVSAISEANGAEATRLVEAPCAGVGPEAPQLECHHAARLRGLDQQRASASTDSVRARIEEAHLLALARQKRDDAACIFREHNLALPENDVLDEAAILGRGVKERKEGQQTNRWRE